MKLFKVIIILAFLTAGFYSIKVMADERPIDPTVKIDEDDLSIMRIMEVLGSCPGKNLDPDSKREASKQLVISAQSNKLTYEKVIAIMASGFKMDDPNCQMALRLIKEVVEEKSSKPKEREGNYIWFKRRLIGDKNTSGDFDTMKSQCHLEIGDGKKSYLDFFKDACEKVLEQIKTPPEEIQNEELLKVKNRSKRVLGCSYWVNEFFFGNHVNLGAEKSRYYYILKKYYNNENNKELISLMDALYEAMITINTGKPNKNFLERAVCESVKSNNSTNFGLNYIKELIAEDREKARLEMCEKFGKVNKLANELAKDYEKCLRSAPPDANKYIEQASRRANELIRVYDENGDFIPGALTKWQEEMALEVDRLLTSDVVQSFLKDYDYFRKPGNENLNYETGKKYFIDKLFDFSKPGCDRSGVIKKLNEMLAAKREVSANLK